MTANILPDHDDSVHAWVFAVVPQFEILFL